MMNIQKDDKKIKDFVIMPREFQYDYQEGKLTKSEFDMIIWIFYNTNPYNGSFSTSYEGLVQDFRGKISYTNARKIISSLRKKGYIYFSNHKGRKGSFLIYPVGFLLTNGEIQTLESIKSRIHTTTYLHCKEQGGSEVKNNLENPHHKLEKEKSALIEKLSMKNQLSKITTFDNNIYN